MKFNIAKSMIFRNIVSFIQGDSLSYIDNLFPIYYLAHKSMHKKIRFRKLKPDFCIPKYSLL